MRLFTLKKVALACVIAAIFLVPSTAGAQCFVNSLRFNVASQQFVTLGPNIPQALTGDYTIEGWFYPTSSAKDQHIWDFGNNAGSLFFLGLFSSGGATLFVDMLDNSTETFIATLTPISLNTWHHFAVVESGGGTLTTLYLDGVSQGTNTIPLPITMNGGTGLTANDYLGKSNFSASNPTFDGYMDEFRIYNAAVYTSNFTPPATAFTADLSTLGLYHMDTGNGQDVFDAVGNFNGVLGADNLAANDDPSWQDCSTLPIYILNFKASIMHDAVKLDWIASKDRNSGNFAIQRSADGKTFSTIGNVTAADDELAHSYTFTDLAPNNGNNFYQLYMTQPGEPDKFSSILSVSIKNMSETFAIYPTVTSRSLVVRVPTASQVNIVDATGAVVRRLQINQSQVVDVSNLAAGYYFVQDKKSGKTFRFFKN